MQLSEPSLTILKNFAVINEGLFFKKGNVVRTVSPLKNIMAEAMIDESFPQDFGIYNLNSFLSVLSLHKDQPQLSWDEKNVFVTGNKGRSKITYRCCDVSNITVPPEKNLTLPTEDMKFTLTAEDFDWILKSASVLASPHLSVVSHGTTLVLKTLDAQNDAAHTDTLELVSNENTVLPGAGAQALFKTENWKMLPGPYEVHISLKGIANFVHITKKLRYWVAIEQRSK